MDLVKVIAGLRGSGAELEDVEAMRTVGSAKGTLPPTIAAFANARGGVVIIGLDEQQGFTAAGVPNTATTRNALLSVGRDKLTPSPEVNVEVVPFEGVSLVVAEVEPLPPSQRPCYVRAKGLYAGAYVREGGDDQKLTPYEIDRMKENAAPPQWDAEPVPQASTKDLDRDSCARLIEHARQRSPRAFGYAGETDALIMLGVLVRHEGRLVPTLAGLLSVGTYPQQYFPQLMVTVAVHREDERGGARPGNPRFTDSATLTGAIPAMVTGAVDVVRRHLKIVGRVVDAGWTDQPEIEPEIIWEAVANALMHRDHSPQARGSQVQVDLFPGRLEVTSPGGLFGNVRPENLGASGTSSSRNPRLAALLQEAIDPVTGFSVAENRGGGIAMMINRVRETTGIVPLLEPDLDQFRIVVPRSSPVTPAFLSALGRRKATARLSETQATALALAHWGRDVDQAVLCRMGLSASAARVELANLVALGLLRPTKARGDGPYRLGADLKPAGQPRPKPREKDPEKEPKPQLLEPRRAEPRSLEPSRPGPGILQSRIPEEQTPEERIMTALRDLEEASRRELQKATGLSRGEVADFLQELLDAGLAESTGARGPGRRYRAAPRKPARRSISTGE